MDYLLLLILISNIYFIFILLLLLFIIIIHYNYQYLLIWPILADNLVCSLFLCHTTEVLNLFVIT